MRYSRIRATMAISNCCSERSTLVLGGWISVLARRTALPAIVPSGCCSGATSVSACSAASLWTLGIRYIIKIVFKVLEFLKNLR